MNGNRLSMSVSKHSSGNWPVQRQLAAINDQFRESSELLKRDDTTQCRPRGSRCLTSAYARSRTGFRLQQINEGLAESYELLDEAIAGNSTSSSRLADAFRQLAEDAENFGSISDVVASGVRRTEDSFVDLATTGKLSFSDLADSVIADLVRLLIRITITQNALRALASAFGGGGSGSLLSSLFGGLFGGGAGAGGGFANSIAGAPRFHTGGLAPRETLGVLMKDEEVLTRRDPRHRYNIGGQSVQELRDWVNHLPRFHQGGIVGGDRGSRSSGSDSMEIRLINNSDTPLQATSVFNERRFKVL